MKKEIKIRGMKVVAPDNDGFSYITLEGAYFMEGQELTLKEARQLCDFLDYHLRWTRWTKANRAERL